MMLLYGMARCIAAALRWNAQRAHDKAQGAYEGLQELFTKLETDCKAEEVALGRPMAYTGQLRLLKAFENAEASRQRWVKSTTRLNRRNKLVEKLNGFHSARLPYTFGLVDMAGIMRGLDYCGLTPELSLTGIFETVKIWLS